MDCKSNYNSHIHSNFHDSYFHDNICRDENPIDEAKRKYLQQYEYELSEKDFYPPEDTRVLRSGVSDIIGGDNFADFTTDMFDIYDEEEYFDNL